MKISSLLFMVLFPISLMFFAECDLFRLQYTPTKFCDPALSGCKVYDIINLIPIKKDITSEWLGSAQPFKIL